MDRDPAAYFKEHDFTGSLVWQIRHQSELDQLEIVLRYNGFVPAIARPLNDPNFQQPMDFRRLLFRSVTHLRRSRCLYKGGFRGFDPTDFNYSAGHSFPAGHLEIDSAYVGKLVDARRTVARYEAGIHIGSFGTYSFEFEGLAAFQRLVKNVPLRGGEVGHFDYNTNAKIAIDDPFADS